MHAVQSLRRWLVIIPTALGLAGLLAAIGLVAAAVPTVAAEKAADLAAYCRTKHGRSAFPSVDRRDDGLMCSRRTSGGLGLLHRKIRAADVCAAQHRTRRFRRQGKGLLCITGRGAATAKTIDLTKHCRAKYGPTAFVTRRQTDGRSMCTIKTDRGLGLRHHLIDLASLCGGGSPRATGDKLRCEGTTVGAGPGGGSGGATSTGPANRGPVPTPRRKGGGKLTKADFRGCSVDRAIVTRKVAMPGWLTRPGHAYLYGAVPTPCPRLAGGRVVDLVEFCRKHRNKQGVVFLDGQAPTCFGPPGRVSVRPYPTPTEWKGWLSGRERRNWGRPEILLGPCYWAGGITMKNQKNFAIVFKYANRRLECFYFKRARYMAIRKPGKGNNRKPKKDKNAPTITEKY
ncbi:MAG: hypothetical protein OEQ29_12330 [Alphaproteobacteria bacterium]|nr:hypothetical protein [Alphaproteobacteria bacterium]